MPSLPYFDFAVKTGLHKWQPTVLKSSTVYTLKLARAQEVFVPFAQTQWVYCNAIVLWICSFSVHAKDG